MSGNYKLYTMYTSPYSDKVRALMHYKSIPFEDHIENAETRFTVLQARTGRTMVPVVITPDDQAMNDSTPIAAYFESHHPQPPTRWEDPGIDTLAMLLEDYADEWMVRIMLASRWYHEEDAKHCGIMIAGNMANDVYGLDLLQAASDFPNGVIATVPLMGATRHNAERWYEMFNRILTALDEALSHDDFITGSGPHLCDFAFFGMINQIRRDPTGHGWLVNGPQPVRGWLDAMETRIKAGKEGAAKNAAASAERDYAEQAERMRDDMVPGREDIPSGSPADDLSHLELLITEAAQTYYRMSVHNCVAVEAGSKDPVHVELLDEFAFEAPPAKYNRKVLSANLDLLEKLYGGGGELPAPAEQLILDELRLLKEKGSPLLEERPALAKAL